jgi:PhnB protein
MSIQPIPEDCRIPTPYLVVDDAARALEFYRDAFGADEHPEVDCLGPRRLGGSASGLVLYVADVDAAIARAVTHGAQVKRAVRDEFYGDRVGDLVDPFGHQWTLASRIEDVSADEVRRRFDAAVRSTSPA